MRIEVLHGKGPKEIFTIKKDKVLLGRSTKCDLQLHHPGISREHLMIELREGNIFISDVGSTNGVFIDGDKIEANKEILYQNYLQLMVGETNVVISPPVDATGSFTLTTKMNLNAPRVHRPPSATTTHAHAPVKMSASKKSMLIPYMAAVMLVGGVAYYYRSQQRNVVVQVVNPVAEKKTFAIPASFEEAKKYEDLWNEIGCISSEEKTICPQIKDVWFPKEHLLVRDNVYLFVNLTKEMAYRGLKTQNLKAFSEIILSSLSTHPLIRALDKPAYALGFVEVDGKAQLKFVLTQNMNGIPVLDLPLHKSVFSRALVGEEWLFQKIIQPDLAIKPL